MFIIGGGVVYEQTLSLCNRLYYTEVDITPQGDVFFPDIDSANWKLLEENRHSKDEKNEFDYTFRILQRIS